MSFKSRRSKTNAALNYEAMEKRQLLAAVIPDFVGDGQIGEVGTIQINQNWTTVNLDQTFNNPVVVSGPASSVENDPLTIRVRNVDSTSFQIAIDEWDYLDGTHASETVSYMVVEGGTHQLTDGTRLVAGYIDDQTHVTQSISTGDLFSSRPILFSQIMTDNDSASATTRMNVTGNNSFSIRIQEQESADNIHAAETVGFVILETATLGSSGDLAFQSIATPNNVNHLSRTVSLSSGVFTSAPALFASMQTQNGGDTATVRSTAISNNSVSFFLEEERSRDPELAHFTAETVGILAIENGALIAAESVAVQPSDRFIALENHILGTDTMTVTELRNFANTFSSQAGSLGNRLADFVAAIEVVGLYEDRVGPLFTSGGVQNFLNSWDGDNNLGRGLARTMLGVYQAVFDAYDNDLVAQHTALVDGVLFRSTENFPGSVPNPTNPSAIYEVQIDGTLNEQFGYVGGYSTNAARRMTGAYLAPGTIVEVIVPDELVNAGYQIRVGGHSWDLSQKNNANRLHRVSNLFDITDNVVQIANPMGGNIYIEVPVGADAGIVDVQFRNTIRAPFFSNRTFDQTTASEWNVERTHAGAFTDIESKHSMFTVPTKWITNLGYAQLLEIVETYDANMRVASEYAGKDADRHKATMYTIVDTQIRGNAFSIGYPQSNWGSFSQDTIRAPLTLGAAFDKVLWHEHGHSEFLTMFAGETESLVHMAAVAIGIENYGFTVQEAFAESLAYGSHNHDTSDALNSWVVMDEFVNGQNMAFQQASYRPRGHADYVEYIEMFGLEALQNFNHRINIEFDGTNLNDSFDEGGRTSHNYNSRILRLSREAGVNVAPLFHLWGHAPSSAASLANEMAAEGLGESVQIYDRLIDARDSVPLSQAEWNVVNNRMSDFLNDNRGPWATYRTNYSVARGQAAVSRIQTLINQYFPNGRPDDVSVEPIAAKVIAYSGQNFEGEPWELTEGLYQIAELNAGPIGNDNVSSILIPEGYEIRVAQWQSNGGTRAVYTGSVADLGSLENDVSRIEVIKTLTNQEAIGESDSISLDSSWKTVTLTQSYDDPVVIAGTPSFEGADPSTVRIRNVTSDSFEIKIDEWDYLDPFHSTEVVSYMVVEAGQYELADGTIVVAGNRTGQNQNVQTYSLGSAFAGQDAPLVFANVVTDSDSATVTTRLDAVTNSSFEVRLQEEEAADGIHGDETVSFFAVQSGAGATGGLHYDAGAFEANNQGQFVNFDSRIKFSSVDSFFAGMQTNNGTDPTTLRNTVLSAAGATVFLEEEQSSDAEVGHTVETIGFFAINAGVIMGSAVAVESFDFEIGGIQPGSGYNQITGDVTLSGPLTVSLTNGFLPSSLDAFVLVRADFSFNGEFENVQSGQRIQTSNGEGSFLVTTTNNLVILSGFEATQSFLLGDTNGDGVVDFDDISPFISVLASDGYLAEADINQDGEVDFSDISLFINRLSQS